MAIPPPQIFPAPAVGLFLLLDGVGIRETPREGPLVAGGDCMVIGMLMGDGIIWGFPEIGVLPNHPFY